MAPARRLPLDSTRHFPRDCWPAPFRRVPGLSRFGPAAGTIASRRLAGLALVGALVVSGLAGSVRPVEGDEWTQFRGPSGQGHADSAELPVVWSAADNVTWKRALPGEGWSSPIVAGGRIYLTMAVPSGGDGEQLSLRAACLDAKTGETRWDTEIFAPDSGSPAPRIHRKNSHASPTPLLEGDRLYVHFGHQGTACLSLDGKLIWTNRELSYHPVHGNGGSPILVDDKLVFSIDGRDRTIVVALDKKTGKVAWQSDRHSTASRKFSFTTPLLIEAEGRRQIVSPASDMVCAYDPATGRELWRVMYDGYSVIPRPVYGHGLVFICTGYNKPSLMAIRPTGTGDVTDTHVAWITGKAVPHTPSLLLVGDELYMVSDNGVASCLDARTGELHWQERLKGAYSASPLYANGRIYFQNETGLGTVVKAGRTFEKLGDNDLGERSLASYAVDQQALLIRTAEHLYRIENR